MQLLNLIIWKFSKGGSLHFDTFHPHFVHYHSSISVLLHFWCIWSYLTFPALAWQEKLTYHMRKIGCTSSSGNRILIALEIYVFSNLLSKIYKLSFRFRSLHILRLAKSHLISSALTDKMAFQTKGSFFTRCFWPRSSPMKHKYSFMSSVSSQIFRLS